MTRARSIAFRSSLRYLLSIILSFLDSKFLIGISSLQELKGQVTDMSAELAKKDANLADMLHKIQLEVLLLLQSFDRKPCDKCVLNSAHLVRHPRLSLLPKSPSP